MTTVDSLLPKIRAKDTCHEVRRSTLRAIGAELDVPETQVNHLALSQLTEEGLHADEPDDSP
jgi:hypothetical protein